MKFSVNHCDIYGILSLNQALVSEKECLGSLSQKETENRKKGTEEKREIQA